MLPANQRIVITGMSAITALGDTLDTYYQNLIAGKSGLRNWICCDVSTIYSKVGGDISDYDWAKKLESMKSELPADVYGRLRKLTKRAPLSTKLSLLVAADAYRDANLYGKIDPIRQMVAVGGHNLNKGYLWSETERFREEHDYMDNMASVFSLDTDHAASVSEALNVHGAIYTVGGACASGNVALRNAIDELRYHDTDVAIVVGATLEYNPMDLHAMCLMGAISFEHFHDDPAKASRPYDTRREGFVPSHGSACLVVETLEHAQKRGAKIHAEVLGVMAGSDGNHLPNPSVDGQVRTMRRLFAQAGIRPEEVDWVCAHATSTPLGDLTELNAIKTVFGDHAKKLKINAPKSMLGHTCWSAPTVETVAAVLQLQNGTLHPTINIEELDPHVDVDVCANTAVRDYNPKICLKNSFGFGGINCCSLLRRFEG